MSTRARAYHRIPQNEASVGPMSHNEMNPHVGALDDDELEDDMNDTDDERDVFKKTRSQQAVVWSTKLHAMLWVIAASVVAYAIDFFHVIFHDPRINKTYFRLGLICFGINSCISCYLAIYLPYIKKIHLEWNVYCPRMIPTATVVGVIASISFICALWPVWGLLTPGLLLLFFIGTLISAHFLPSI